MNTQDLKEEFGRAIFNRLFEIRTLGSDSGYGSKGRQTREVPKGQWLRLIGGLQMKIVIKVDEGIVDSILASEPCEVVVIESGKMAIPPFIVEPENVEVSATAISEFDRIVAEISQRENTERFATDKEW